MTISDTTGRAWRCLVVGVCCALVTSWMPASSDHDGDRTREGREPAATTEIVVVSACEGGTIQQATVFVFVRTGELIFIGATDESGRLPVKKNVLTGPEPQLLLVCASHHFCSAVRLDEIRPSDYGEFLIALAPFALQ
jgi:hypothetical protein